LPLNVEPDRGGTEPAQVWCMKQHVASEQRTLLGVPNATTPSTPIMRESGEAERPAHGEDSGSHAGTAKNADTDATPTTDDEVELASCLVEPVPVSARSRAARQNQLGKETLASLGPSFVRPLARSQRPLRGPLFTPGLFIAVAFVLSVLSSASVALAMH